jgi:1-acyl-sn-glycerol-3-phosphate acyltransferase
LWRAEVEGSLRVPPDQGAIIICNHRSPFDPAFIQLATRRIVHWMVAREYVSSALTGWFLRIPRVIPVGRGGIDTAATKQAIRLAQNGGLVGLLPEGRINTTEKLLLPGRPGAALVALKSRVPIIPCYVSGSPMGKTILGSLFIPAKVRLVIGRPLDISQYYGQEKNREVLEELTRLFLKEIARLAGVEDYQPDLAGRKWLPEE